VLYNDIVIKNRTKSESEDNHMTKLNKTTKKAQAFIDSYERATGTTLSDIYGSYSSAKAQAERDCRDRMAQLNAYDFRMMSGNSFAFTCGYRTDDTLYIETSANTYAIAL
jgi:hypothetical protein